MIKIDQSKAKEAQRIALKEARDNALNALAYELPDASKIQTRPSDQVNIETAIALGVDRKFVMQDNSIRMTTVAELQDALNYGFVAAEAVWDEYIAGLEAL